MPKVVLAGNNRAAVLVLDLLLDTLDAMDILAVAPPIDPLHPWHSSLADKARDKNVRVLTPDDVNDDAVVGEVAAYDAELLLSVYYHRVFREPFLTAIRGPALNFHPSLLPRHRGVAPLIWAIVEGDVVAGVSVHHMDTGIDTGDIVWSAPLPIHPDDTGYDLHLKAAYLVRAAASSVLRQWLATQVIPPGTPQSGVSSVHRSTDPPLNHIDWRQPAERIRNVVRSLAPPLPGAFALLREAPVTLTRVVPVQVDRALPRRAPGMLTVLESGEVLVWTDDGVVRVDSAFLDGGSVSGVEMASALGVAEGDLFE